MRILIVDNYDSFTYNLVQYLGELGAALTVWRNDQFQLEDVERLSPDSIVVSPGPCTPSEAGLSVPLIQRYAPQYPILGVCLGHQSIGQAFGAKVTRAKVVMHGKTSEIHHDGTGVFAGLPQPFTATRYHSLVVEASFRGDSRVASFRGDSRVASFRGDSWEGLPPELRVNAWVDEAGGRTVMGLEHTRYPTYGVQFHPESILTEIGKQILSNFLEKCRGFSPIRDRLSY